MEEKTRIFTIDDRHLAKRRANILWGGALSLLLAAVILVGHYRYPQTYTDALLWSVVVFVVGANLVNYLRHRRYLRLIRDHSLEVTPGKLHFRTAGELSTLDVSDIALINLYRRKGDMRHIQIRLTNNRGIRLEGYHNLEHIGELLAEQVPKSHLVEREI